MNYIEVLAATFSTFFFGIIFSLTGKKLFYSSFAGGLGWYTHLLFFKELGYSKTASYVVSAMIIAISSINSISSWWWNILYYVFFC